MPPRKKIEPWFNIERDAAAAIDPAKTSGDWEKLATTLDTLCQARQSISKAARDGRIVQIIDCMEVADAIQENGRYLVIPPLVARDASIIDHTLKSVGISALILCREPKTKLGLCPIVALGSGVTIRTQVKEPSNPQKPSNTWFDQAMHTLGECAIERTDVETSLQRQLNYLLAHLSAIPMHTNVYQAAIAVCNALVSERV